MSEPKDGGSAYPHSDVEIWTEGMSLLDHFAGLAMQAMLYHEDPPNSKTLARNAYKEAAAMIAERERRINEERNPND